MFGAGGAGRPAGWARVGMERQSGWARWAGVAGLVRLGGLWVAGPGEGWLAGPGEEMDGPGG